MSQGESAKVWPGEPPGLWPAPEAATRDERRPDAERIAVIHEGVRIEHAASRRAGSALVAFVDRPWEPHQRWRGMLLVGPARSGRSWLLSHRLPPDDHRRQGGAITAQLPVDPNNDRILHAILAAGERSPPWPKGPEMRSAALKKLCTAKALVFDGCDHLAELPGSRLRRVLAGLKGIAEGQRVPFVMAVTPAILQRVSDDPDWEARFEILHLPRLRVDADFLALLTEWEDRLPLEGASRLADREMALHLYSLCDGSIGRLGKVLRDASLAAIDNGRERITIGLLDQLGLSPAPSFRKFLF